MIHRSEQSWQVTWQQELQHLITTPKTLLEMAGLDMAMLPAANAAAALFPVRATRAYVSRIEKGNWADPLLRQILPIGAELHSPSHFTDDPLEETQFNPVPGVVHKYRSRVLLIAATQCAINCRYCFRRAFPYEDNRLDKKQWQDALSYIRQHTELNEVILSGGDPLACSDIQMAWLIQSLADIPHIKRVRLHTRFPIVLPNRITPEFINALINPSLQTVLVVHCNHANELDAAVGKALGTLKNAGVTLLNQTVLLKGVNDCPVQLHNLSEALFDLSVLPYYLHLLDAVKGAAHFAVDLEQAKNIMRQLLASLPGFLVPKLVQEKPNQPSKTPIHCF